MNTENTPSVEREPDNWLALAVDVAEHGEHEILTVHANWLGPAKFVHGPKGIERRIDICLSDHRRPAADPVLDDQAARQQQSLYKEVVRRARACLTGPAQSDRSDSSEDNDWNPPAAKTLLKWLIGDGRTATMDEQDNVRMTLQGSGCDGQVHVECSPARLRFAMPLGHWKSLAPKAEAIMLRLAAEANSRCRLVRVAWTCQQDGCHCEAQADLTGVLPADLDNQAAESMARGMILAAADGLELVLRQLYHVLAALGEGKHDELTELMFFDREE